MDKCAFKMQGTSYGTMAGKRKKPDFSDVTEIAWRYAREVEHSDFNLDMLEKWMWKSFTKE